MHLVKPAAAAQLLHWQLQQSAQGLMNLSLRKGVLAGRMAMHLLGVSMAAGSRASFPSCFVLKTVLFELQLTEVGDAAGSCVHSTNILIAGYQQHVYVTVFTIPNMQLIIGTMYGLCVHCATAVNIH